MIEAAVVLGALLVPVLGLGLLLWLTHLEETLPRDVSAGQRRPAPAPILAIPVRQATAPLTVPEQRAPAPAPAAEAQAFSRSGTLSLGGSTNR